jgi:transcription initiation factor TFIIB
MQNNLSTTNMAQLQPQQITTLCSVCKYDSIAITDVESGEIICNKCGIVISERIEEIDQQQHIFPAGEISRETRTGAPSSLARHDRGLFTIHSFPMMG